MAEETMTTEQEPTEQLEAEKDWKAKYEEMRGHMREWQKRAQVNQSAADELEKLKAEQMTEQEKEKARADAAEAELASLRAEHERTSAAQRIASESGIPLDLLLYCKDEEAMTEFATVYAKEVHVNAAPSANGSSRIVRSESKGISNGELFAELAEQLIKK